MTLSIQLTFISLPQYHNITNESFCCFFSLSISQLHSQSCHTLLDIPFSNTPLVLHIQTTHAGWISLLCTGLNLDNFKSSKHTNPYPDHCSQLLTPHFKILLESTSWFICLYYSALYTMQLSFFLPYYCITLVTTIIN